MDIERLKELKDYLRVANELSILNDDNLMQRIVDNNDVTDTIDIAIELLNAEIARQSVTDEVVCPNCGGSGVYQEYDEYDRYYVYACHECEGTGEIARQSVKSEEVAEAIEQLKYAREQDREFDDGTFVDSLDLAITALQAYQPWIPVSERLPMEEPDGRHSASKMVLVYAYNGYSDRFASTDITVDGKWYNYSEPEFEVTHWMPLPEPPKGETL